jgi:hypothetical protein
LAAWNPPKRSGVTEFAVLLAAVVRKVDTAFFKKDTRRGPGQRFSTTPGALHS